MKQTKKRLPGIRKEFRSEQRLRSIERRLKKMRDMAEAAILRYLRSVHTRVLAEYPLGICKSSRIKRIVLHFGEGKPKVELFTGSHPGKKKVGAKKIPTQKRHHKH